MLEELPVLGCRLDLCFTADSFPASCFAVCFTELGNGFLEKKWDDEVAENAELLMREPDILVIGSALC